MLFELVVWRTLPAVRQIIYNSRGPAAFPTPQVGNRMEVRPPGQLPVALVVSEVTFVVTPTIITTNVVCE